jgi:site-specific DNA-methyltransferase (adenine-specific)
VLRDVTERVIIASKGCFDRALSERARAKAGLPHVASTTADEFMAATLDLWSIDAESATRIGHPAPFPVELPRRLIELYTYEDDLVLDPFLGSGTTLVAAKGAGRRGIGVDLDSAYVALAQHRVDEAIRAPLASESVTFKTHVTQVFSELSLQPTPAPKRKGAVVAADLLVKHGNDDIEVFIVGGWTVARSGLESTTTALELIGRATLLAKAGAKQILCITPQLPSPQSESARIFRASEELLRVVVGTKAALHTHFFSPSKEPLSP